MGEISSNKSTSKGMMGKLLGKVHEGIQEIGGFGPAVKGFSGVEIKSSSETDGIHTWLVELYGIFSLVNALLVTTAVEPFSSLLGEADTALNYSFVYFWWTLSLIVNLMALYSSVLMLATVLAVPKDHDCIHAFVDQCTDGWIQTLAMPAFLTLLGAFVGAIAIFVSSWYAPRPWTFWLLFGLTCTFVSILAMAFRKADKARRDALKKKE